MVDTCLTGFLRIVTNSRIVPVPAPIGEVLHFVDRLRNARRARHLAATTATWATLHEIVADDRGIRAKLVPDAYLAALAISHRCRLATAERGFGRFKGLDFLDPAG